MDRLAAVSSLNPHFLVESSSLDALEILRLLLLISQDKTLYVGTADWGKHSAALFACSIGT